jgi:raffinose/stachyose/melibiose transport system permease protein
MADSTLTAQRSRAQQRPRDSRGTRRRRAEWVGYLPYLLPGAAAFIVVIGYPLMTNVYFSLFKWRGGMAPLRWNGLGNYVDLLGDDKFWTSFGNSLAMIVAMVLVPTLLGLVLAAVLFDSDGGSARRSPRCCGPRTTCRRSCPSPWRACSGTGS